MPWPAITPRSPAPADVETPAPSPPSGGPTPPEPGRAERPVGFRTELAEKIFLDRYSLKATDKSTVKAGATVIYCPNPDDDEKARRREIGVVLEVHADRAEADVRPRDDEDAEPMRVSLDHVDAPSS